MTYESKNGNEASFTGVVAQKEKLQSQLDKALDEIEKLRTEVHEQKKTIGDGHCVTQIDLNNLPDDDDDEEGEEEDEENLPISMVAKKGANMSVNLGMPKQKNFETQVPKKKIPALDFSNLRQGREYKDWYSYAKKLESAIKLLRERISDMEHSETMHMEEKEEANERIQSLEANNRRL